MLRVRREREGRITFNVEEDVLVRRYVRRDFFWERYQQFAGLLDPEWQIPHLIEEDRPPNTLFVSVLNCHCHVMLYTLYSNVF